MPGAPANSIHEYIALLQDDVRDTAEAVRQTILRILPEAEETIRYGIPAFVLGGHSIIYFAVWKSHIGLYPIYRGTEEFERIVSPYRARKDTVQFPLKSPIPLDLVSRIVASQLVTNQR